MVYIIYNPLGCGFAVLAWAVGFGVAFGLRLVTSEETADRVGWFVCAGIFVVGDVWYRLSHFKDLGWSRIVRPKTGGHLYYIPSWMLGVLIALLVIQMWLVPYRPRSRPATPATSPRTAAQR